MEIFGIFLLFSLFRLVYYLSVGLLYKRPVSERKLYNPFVTVIIPAWNEEVGIRKTIRSVMNNGYKNIEVIVVNDGSKDNTEEVVESVKRSYWKNKNKIRLINKENGGKAQALNTGISLSKGEIIITIDADSYIRRGTIRNLIQPFANDKCDVTIGQILVGNIRSLIGIAQYLEYTLGFHHKRAQNVLGSIYIFPGALSAFKKEVLEEVNYYETYSCTEDLDLSMKIRSNGRNVVYVDNAVCVTEGPSSIKGLFNQRVRWRHGFLQCVLYRKNFLFSNIKGRYLSYIEFPLSILGMLEVFFFPFFLTYLMTQIMSSSDLLVIIISFFFLPYVFFLVKHDQVKIPFYKLPLVLMLPIFLTFINFIEFIALNKSIYRVLTKQNTNWTIWNRQGV